MHRQSHIHRNVQDFACNSTLSLYPHVAKTIKRLIERENVIKESRLQCNYLNVSLHRLSMYSSSICFYTLLGTIEPQS